MIPAFVLPALRMEQFPITVRVRSLHDDSVLEEIVADEPSQMVVRITTKWFWLEFRCADGTVISTKNEKTKMPDDFDLLMDLSSLGSERVRIARGLLTPEDRVRITDIINRRYKRVN